MCKFCCSHRGLNLSTPHACIESYHPSPETPTYHVGFFPMLNQGVLFPSQHILLDVYIASSLHLLSTILSDGMHHEAPEAWSHPHQHLLPRVFAIAPKPTSTFGALATFPPNTPAVIPRTHPLRFHVHIIARYQLAAPPHLHAPYPCVSVRLLCDLPHPLPFPSLDQAFPPIAPPAPPIQTSAVRTRATTMRIAMRRKEPRRSSANMAGLSYSHWRVNSPPHLAQRARSSACFSRLTIDRLLMAHIPLEDACPSHWSFWLSAALPADTSHEVLNELLGTNSVIARLRKLISMFEEASHSAKSRKRPRQSDARNQALSIHPTNHSGQTNRGESGTRRRRLR